MTDLFRSGSYKEVEFISASESSSNDDDESDVGSSSSATSSSSSISDHNTRVVVARNAPPASARMTTGVVATFSDDDTDDMSDQEGVITFLLPNDDEFKPPFTIELPYSARIRIRTLKETLCEKLKLSNAERFSLQTLQGRYVAGGERVAGCFDANLPRILVVRRDMSYRVQEAVAARLAMFAKPVPPPLTLSHSTQLLLPSTPATPHAETGGTASSFDDEDTDRRTTSAEKAAVQSSVQPTTTTTSTTTAVAAAAAARGTSQSTLTTTTTTTATTTSDNIGGWVVEFLFPPHVTAFGSLQKKSMRVNPVLPMRALVASLVDKCVAPSLSSRDRESLAASLELQSITGVVFRDNDTLSENYFLDQGAVITLVVREVLPVGFAKRGGRVHGVRSAANARPSLSTARRDSADDDGSMSANIADTDMTTTTTTVNTRTHHQKPLALSSSTSVAHTAHSLSSSPASVVTDNSGDEAARNNARRRKIARAGGERNIGFVIVLLRLLLLGNAVAAASTTSTTTTVVASTTTTTILSLTPTLSNSPMKLAPTVITPTSTTSTSTSTTTATSTAAATVGNDSISPRRSNAAGDGACICVFTLPPSELFHGLERKRLAVGAFATIAAIKERLFESMRCTANPADYELRTRDMSALHDDIAAAVAASNAASLSGDSLTPPLSHSPAAMSSMQLVAAALGGGGGGVESTSSPRRLIGRSFLGHVFKDTERLADVIRMDKFALIELELVARGSTHKLLAVSNVPTGGGKSSSAFNIEPKPTSLAHVISIDSLNSVLPIDAVLSGRQRAPAKVSSPRQPPPSHDISHQPPPAASSQQQNTPPLPASPASVSRRAHSVHSGEHAHRRRAAAAAAAVVATAGGTSSGGVAMTTGAAGSPPLPPLSASVSTDHSSFERALSSPALPPLAIGTSSTTSTTSTSTPTSDAIPRARSGLLSYAEVVRSIRAREGGLLSPRSSENVNSGTNNAAAAVAVVASNNSSTAALKSSPRNSTTDKDVRSPRPAKSTVEVEEQAEPKTLKRLAFAPDSKADSDDSAMGTQPMPRDASDDAKRKRRLQRKSVAF